MEEQESSSEKPLSPEARKALERERWKLLLCSRSVNKEAPDERHND